jgi:hypothetical protein
MQQLLIIKLRDYITENNPDLLLSLQQHHQLSGYLEEKVNGIADFIDELNDQSYASYEIEELCMERLTADLRPSHYLYIQKILEEEFEKEFVSMSENGLLIFEVINLIEACSRVFESMPLTEEQEDDSSLRYAVTGTIKEYFENRAVTTEN